MKLCDRCRVTGCLLNYGGKACQNARRKECPDVVFTNADRIREMSDEELAEAFNTADWCKVCGQQKENGTCHAMEQGGPLYSYCVAGCLEWLREPAEAL